jgi:hypothetical protein
MDPSIFTVASVPAIATLGNATEVERGEVCPVCNRQPAPQFASVEFVFDMWDGEDLVIAMDVYAASERLRDAIERAGLTGARFEDMSIARAEHFELGEDAYAGDLPRFHRFEFAGRSRGPEIWWESTYCDDCGLRSWERTPEGTRAEMSIAFGNPAPRREVYRSSWSRDDLFRLEDPGPPLVTERAKDLFESVPVKEVTFQPAEWVDE